MGLGSDYLMMITSAVRFRQIHLVCAGNERRAHHFAHKLAVSFPTPNRLEMESILFSLKAVTVLKSRCLFARHFFENFLVHDVWSREKKWRDNGRTFLFSVSVRRGLSSLVHFGPTIGLASLPRISFPYKRYWTFFLGLSCRIPPLYSGLPFSSVDSSPRE